MHLPDSRSRKAFLVGYSDPAATLLSLLFCWVAPEQLGFKTRFFFVVLLLAILIKGVSIFRRTLDPTRTNETLGKAAAYLVFLVAVVILFYQQTAGLIFACLVGGPAAILALYFGSFPLEQSEAVNQPDNHHDR